MDLHPIVALIPCHAYLFKIVLEVDCGVGMLSEADDTETLVDYCHRYWCSLGYECLDEFVGMHGEH